METCLAVRAAAGIKASIGRSIGGQKRSRIPFFGVASGCVKTGRFLSEVVRNDMFEDAQFSSDKPRMLSNAFVINLDRTPERLAHFRSINPHLTDVTRFSATDGRALKLDELVKQGLFEEPIFYSPGALGAMHSHIRMWELAASKDTWTTVFEDDAIVHQRFGLLAPPLLDAAGDLDIVLWGWNFDEAVSFDVFPGVPSLTHFSQEDMRKMAVSIQSAPISPALRRLYYGFGLVGYSISPAGATKLLNRALPSRPFLYKVPLFGLEVENTGIDSITSVLYSEMNAFACVPPLVITRNDHSNSTTHESNADVINRVRRKLRLSTGGGEGHSGFRPEPRLDYFGSRKFTRKYLNYLDRKGDVAGTIIEFIQYCLMRSHWYENFRGRRYRRGRTSALSPN
jgi:glycosyl transferase, family 25